MKTGLHLYEVLGDYPVGITLLEAHCGHHPEVTVEYVVARLEGRYGDDTTRRKLLRMKKSGLITSRKDGRTIYYRLKPEIAEAALDLIENQVAKFQERSG